MIYAAAVVTWVAATVTAFVSLLLTATLLWVASPIFEYFESGLSNPKWIYLAPLLVTAAAGSVVVLLLLPDARAWFRGGTGAPHLPTESRTAAPEIYLPHE